MIFNITNAGGKYGGFNFSVVPYASESELPEFADENTIAIIPKSEMSSWIFSMTEPSNPTDGMVWIAIGKLSTAEINIVRDNAIMLYPLYAKQYVNGAWVNISALSYNADGEQVKWMSDIILYDNGATDITLDKTTNVKDSGTYLAVTMNKHASGVLDDTAYARALVNLSGQKTLQVVFSNLSDEGTGGVHARVWDSDGEVVEGYEGTRNETSSTKETTLTLDISTLKGSYMVGAYTSNSSSSSTSTVRINSIKVLM